MEDRNRVLKIMLSKEERDIAVRALYAYANEFNRLVEHASPYISEGLSMTARDAEDLKERLRILDERDMLTMVQELLKQDLKVEAIRLVRNMTGLGLKESKEYVDKVQVGQTPSI